MKLTALDDFAGTGWGVACDWLGIEERGVELMPEAVATRDANGMVTIGRDVWEHLATQAAEPWLYDLYIASPPCQTFSMAGGGAGRRALDEVVALIDFRAYLDVEALHAFGETHDPRTSLVLAPLARIAADAPLYVVLEQVPPVLPVWERYAVELHSWGYSVWVGIIYAEQYGVPQTRKRAVLIARADGIEAAPPTPTHSRYYSHAPKRLDPGVLPWISMAEALSWQVGEGDALVRTSRGVPKERHADGSRAGGHHTLDPATRPAHTATSATAAWEISPGAKYFYPMSYGRRGIWPGDEPPPTIRGVNRPMPETYEPHPSDAIEWHDAARWWFRGNQKPGGGTEHQTRAVELPAPSITSGSRSAQWLKERPATTVAGDSRVWPPGHKVNAADIARDPLAREKYGGRAGTNAIRVTAEEAAALQSYPPGFVFAGSKGKQYLQIGNAVPPLMAAAILSVFL